MATLLNTLLNAALPRKGEPGPPSALTSLFYAVSRSLEIVATQLGPSNATGSTNG